MARSRNRRWRGRCSDAGGAAGICLAYVTGRHPALVEAAIAEYALPRPALSSPMSAPACTKSMPTPGSRRQDWATGHRGRLGRLDQPPIWPRCCGIFRSALQETSKQGNFKLSYYAPPLDDPSDLLQRVRDRLESSGAEVNLIWSIDETSATGLLDILPAAASKLHALEFLRAGWAFRCNRRCSPATAATTWKCWSATSRRYWSPTRRTRSAPKRRRGPTRLLCISPRAACSA
jgi:hypothetical protein